MKKLCHKTLTLKTPNNKKQTIIGTLIPIAWDRKGKAIKFSIYSNEGEDIILKEYRYKNRLKRLLNKKVEVTGEVTHNKYGDKFIKLKTIKDFLDSSSSSMYLRDLQSGQLWDEDFSIHIPKKHQLPDILESSYSFA